MNKPIQNVQENVNTNVSPKTSISERREECDQIARGYKAVKKYSSSGRRVPPEYLDPDYVFLIVSMGREIGFKPMQSLQNINIINGKPVLWGDGMIAVVRSSGELGSFHESFSLNDLDESKMSRQELIEKVYIDSFCAICELTRAGHTKKTYKFSVLDAKVAGLWSFSTSMSHSPWSKYPKRMLQMRARSWALRDTFADKLAGFSTVEEARDIYQDYTITENVPSDIKQPKEDKPITEEQETFLIDPKREGREKEGLINRYLEEICEATGRTKDMITSRANENFEDFYSKYLDWREINKEAD